MARYEKNTGEKTLTVGWDRPMQTFFAQLSINQAEDDLRDLPLDFWLGKDNDEFTDFQEFVDGLEAQGHTLETVIEIQLRRDRLGADPLDAESLAEKGWVKKL